MVLRLVVGVVGVLGCWISALTLEVVRSDMLSRVNERLPPERRFPLPGPGWRHDPLGVRRQLRSSYGLLVPEGTLLQRERLVRVLMILFTLVAGSAVLLPWG